MQYQIQAYNLPQKDTNIQWEQLSVNEPQLGKGFMIM